MMSRPMDAAGWVFFTRAATLGCAVLLVTSCAAGPSLASPDGSPSPGGSIAPPGTAGPIGIALRPVATGLSSPLYLADAGDVPGRLYVVEQGGRILVIDEGTVQSTPFLDISDRVTAGGERGLLSVAFPPDYALRGRFFVDYTDRNGDTVIERYERSADGSTADPTSGDVILTIGQPAGNHNGGLVLFGPDGYLYVGMGDGGGGGAANAKKENTLLGKMLRIDVSSDAPYAVPPDNPFVDDPAVRGEIWALGLRNPWRYSFDRETGDLWIGDVGGGRWEEIDFQAASSRGGENYGWPPFEGPDCVREPCDPSRFVAPVAAYRHGEGDCVVTGGYVYRGAGIPELRGTYLYGDYCSGRIWGLAAADAPSGRAEAQLLLQSGLRVSSFGEDRDGEVYVTDLSGGVYQFVRSP